jgi:hypothetical protein
LSDPGMLNIVLDGCKAELQILQAELDDLLGSNPLDVTAVQDVARRTSAVALNLAAVSFAILAGRPSGDPVN